jgi:hypothetical protein
MILRESLIDWVPSLVPYSSVLNTLKVGLLPNWAARGSVRKATCGTYSGGARADSSPFKVAGPRIF